MPDIIIYDAEMKSYFEVIALDEKRDERNTAQVEADRRRALAEHMHCQKCKAAALEVVAYWERQARV